MLRPVHFESAEEANLRMSAVHDDSVTLSLKAQHAQIPDASNFGFLSHLASRMSFRPPFRSTLGCCEWELYCGLEFLDGVF